MSTFISACSNPGPYRFGSLEGPIGGIENMLRDAALLGSGLRFRVYRWDGVWVSLGTGQSPERALVDPGATRWVKRPTGGRAVLHGHDVTLGLAMPLASLGLAEGEGRSVRKVYQRIVPLLGEALRLSGVGAAQNGSRTPYGPGADCFAHVAATDLVDASGQKVCGCALRIYRGSVLAQASIPAGPPLCEPASVIRNGAPAYWVRLSPEALAGAMERVLAQFAS
ncbi:MAG: hypothetical protein KIT11_00600 [Fimbriimonadaceae bacterium]|nr:hypothetical protein [Fimbriimonadaceae bacterium]QYK55128.1 MAG: hypothetical protein KF733_08935 [Fimbriimonadaceae bacterium]